MTTRESDLRAFVEWFEGASSHLLQVPPEEAAEDIGNHLIAVDKRLGVEIGDDSHGIREMIVTAFSDPEAFPSVRTIVAMTADTPGWNVVPLKPARGFAFNVEVAGRTLDASQLMYVILPDQGIGLVVPRSVMALLPEGRDTEELAWLIVEGGMGEMLAARLSHIEFVPGPRADAKPIHQLSTDVGHWA